VFAKPNRKLRSISLNFYRRFSLDWFLRGQFVK